MKKGLILCLALVAILTVNAFALKATPKSMYGVNDNTTTAPRSGSVNVDVTKLNKAVTTVVLDTINNIRTLLSSSSRNLTLAPGATSADDTVQIAYLRGTGATYALWHGYTFDGGANWTKLLVDNTSRPRYPAVVPGDNDEGNSQYRPIQIAYHRQLDYSGGVSQMYFCREEGSVGDGLYTSYLISDGADASIWIPSFNRGTTSYSITGFDNGTLGTIWATFSNDKGTTWNPNPMIEYPTFEDFAYAPMMLYHTHQESVFAYMPFWLSPLDASLAASQPCYWLSSDSGVTFSGPYPVVPETLLPQFAGAIWWYHYDAIMVNNVPHIVFAMNDYEGDMAGPNGSAIFHATLKVPGDYSQGWKITRASEPEDPINGYGVLPGDPSIGADAAGNLYISYNDQSMSTGTSGIEMVASTDGGDHWTNPYIVVPRSATDAYDLYPQEMAREVGTAVHLVSCDGVQTPDAGGPGPLYHYSVPVSEVLATGLAPQVNAPYLYTEGIPMGTGDTTLTPAGDTLYFSWSTGFGYGGVYELWASTDSTWATNNYHMFLNDNEVISIGMPTAGGKWFWRVRASYNGETSAWSEVYCFTYGGSAVETKWWPEGVTGKPQDKPVYGFALNQSRPNPVKGSAEISFSLPKAGNYSLTIYNIVGQPVKVLEGKGAAGTNKVSWNSCDNNGRKVANGVYLYTLKALGNTATKKLVVVR